MLCPLLDAEATAVDMLDFVALKKVTLKMVTHNRQQHTRCESCNPRGSGSTEKVPDVVGESGKSPQKKDS